MYMIIPLYIDEISPRKSRGRMGSLIGPGYNGGILVGTILNVGFSRFSVGWRVSNGILALLAVVNAVSFGFMPHTPR